MKKAAKKKTKEISIKFSDSLSPIIIAYNEREGERPIAPKNTKNKVKPLAELISGCLSTPLEPSQVVEEASVSICKYFGSLDAFPTDSVRFEGGERISTIDVVPIFYGTVWSSSNPSINDIMNGIKTLFQTPYLSQLNQYGFSSLFVRQPIWVVTPPLSASHKSDEIGDIVWNLIDNGVFPQPDEPGGRNIYMVFYPDGTGVSDLSACGWHHSYSDFDLPFDIDWAWVGAVEFPKGDGTATPKQTLDNILRIFSHELIEMITDPDPDNKGWRMNRTINGGTEIGDACNNLVDFTNGVYAQAYWSEKHKACIIPKLKATISISSKTETVSSKIVSSGVAHFESPQCEELNGNYKWSNYFNSIQATFTAKPSINLINPIFEWTLPQIQYTNSVLPNNFDGIVYIKAETSYLDVNGNQVSTQIFPIHVKVDNNKLIVINENSNNVFSFSLDVKVRGSYGAIIATSQDLDYFESQTFLLEDAYYDVLRACIHRFIKKKLAIKKRFPTQIPKDKRWVWVDTISHFIKGEQWTLAVETAALIASYQEKYPDTAFELRSELASLLRIPKQLLEPVQIIKGKVKNK